MFNYHLKIIEKSGLTTGCDATDPATDQCDVADSECRVDGTAQCLCKATHYTDSTACTISKPKTINLCCNFLLVFRVILNHNSVIFGFAQPRGAFVYLFF